MSLSSADTVTPELTLYCLPPSPAPLPLVARRYRIDAGLLQQLTEPDQPLPASLSRAVLKRQVEFAAGRWCAIRALRRCGYGGPSVIPIGIERAPCWPMGYIGAISHCKGLAVAIAGEQQHYSGVGIDIERPVPIDTLRQIISHVATQPELKIGIAQGLPYDIWSTILFSAKESLFKALYPTVGRYFDFLDAVITQLDRHTGYLQLQLVNSLSTRHIAGNRYRVDFAVGHEYLVTRCLLEAWP